MKTQSLLKKHIFNRYSSSTKHNFAKFHSSNPDVYKIFADLARKMKNSGKKKYSAETLVNVIRWEKDLVTYGDRFKINNNYRSIYARMFVYFNPKFKGFFEMR